MFVQERLYVAMTLSAALVGSAPQVSAQCAPLEFAKLIAPGGATDDSTGNAVCIDGEFAVVGAGIASVADIYGRNDDGWSHLATITGDDTGPLDRFGFSVDISGTTVVVGANQAGNGAAYVFEPLGRDWVQVAKFVASDGVAGDGFGWDVGVSDDVIVVGAPGVDVSTGAAYVFERTDGIWSESVKLTPRESTVRFGDAVDVAGDFAIIGAPRSDDLRGSAYVFGRNRGVWSERTILSPVELESLDFFGSSLDMEGGVAIVSASNDDGARGAAYLYELKGVTWTEVQRIEASPRVSETLFGASVGISDDMAVVGSPYVDGVGSAYVFERLGDRWSQTEILRAADSRPGDSFGDGAAVSGGCAFVGATGDDNPRGANAGAVYVFERSLCVQVSPNPIQSGELVTFQISDGKPVATTFLVYSLEGLGNVYIPPLAVMLNIMNPLQLGPRLTTDANGSASLTFRAPYSREQTPLWIQAVQYGIASDVVVTHIGL